MLNDLLSACQEIFFTIGKNRAGTTAIMGLSRPYGRGGLSVPVHPHERDAAVAHEGPHLHRIGRTGISDQSIHTVHG